MTTKKKQINIIKGASRPLRSGGLLGSGSHGAAGWAQKTGK